MPRVIRLAKWGRNESVKGPYVLDRKNAARVLKRFADYGNDLVCDFEHASVNRVTDGPMTPSGWIRQGALELRSDGLYARVDWDPAAEALIAQKKYRYYSPAFMTDDRGVIQEVLPLALTNFPATIGMKPLVASRGSSMDQTLEELLEAAIKDKVGGDVDVTAIYPGKCAFTGVDGRAS